MIGTNVSLVDKSREHHEELRDLEVKGALLIAGRSSKSSGRIRHDCESCIANQLVLRVGSKFEDERVC